MRMPKEGTLERIMLEKLFDADGLDGRPSGVSYLDLEGTGITEENIEQIVQNLRTGNYKADGDPDYCEKQ